MRTFWQDLRYGVRVLMGSPGFTAVAVLTLALGVAVNTTVFSWVDTLLLRPFPGARNSQQLAVLEMQTTGAPNGANQTSYLDYRDYRANLKSLSGLAVHREDVFSLGQAADAQPVWGELVSGNYFAVLDVRPALGRMFTSDEDGDALGAYPVAVISYRLWRDRFQADPRAVGKTFRVNQRELTLVGVAPPEFRGTMPGLAFDIWVPVTMGVDLRMLDLPDFRRRGNRCLYAVARLKPGISIEQARAEAATFSRSLAALAPDSNRRVTATILPVWRFHSGAPDLLLKPLQILMAVSLLVLLIACANVANLLLARSVARRKELSIRLALGAGPGRLSRQLFTETLLLAGVGALAGLPLAFWMGDLLPALVPRIGVSVAAGFELNGRVLGFTALACVAAALAAGAAPVLFWRRSDVAEALKEGGRGGGPGVHSHRARALLVIAEVALATVALVGAGLFVRSFHNARSIYPGFDRGNVVLARFYLSGARFSTLEAHQFCLRLTDRLRPAPGILDAAYADSAPLGSSAGPYSGVQVEGYVPPEGDAMQINRYLVSPGYFHLLKIPLLEGREFRESDDWNTPPVLIVNQSFARRFFPAGSVLGRKVRCWGKWHTVVGLVQDSKYFDIAESPRPHFFAPFQQRAGWDAQLYFFLKVRGAPAAAMAALRREVAAVDPNAGAFTPMMLEDWTDVTLLPQRVAASLLTVLGLVALLLASVGLYSVMAYAVTQRTQEIGVRMALGAQPGDVLRDVLCRGAALTGIGLVVGSAAALTVARLVASMLVRLSADDPATLAMATLFLAVVSMLASYIPARRATKVDPMIALRWE
ncbi:MAG TPA: ABC transporter permease [Bryobacteraceae bacterium]|nr:ABC transporter permease [Bryobacteraceae bacterium]